MEKNVQRTVANGMALPLNATLLKQLGELIDAAPERVPCENACFHLLSHNRRRIICQAVSFGYRATQLAYGLDLSDCPGVLLALQDRNVVCVNDAATCDLVAKVASERYKLRAAMYVPVLYQQESIGVLVFSYKHIHEWTEQQVVQARMIAEECSVLLHKRHTLPTATGATSLVERRLEALLDAVPGLVVAVDRDGITYAANEHITSFEQGNDGASLQRTTIYRLINDPTRGADLRQAIQDVCSGDTVCFEAMVESEGNLWLIRVRPIPTPEGIEGAAVACIDMAEVLKAKSVLDAARHMEALGLIAANVAHEFNNLLQIFSGSLEKISEDTISEESQEQIMVANQAIERGSKLARQLLTFSKTRPPHTQLADPVALITEWWTLLETTVGRSNPLEMVMRGSARVKVDADQLQIALINLCMNARHASRDGEKINIQIGRIQRDGSTFVAIAVVDRGHGMPPEVLKRATEPFFTTRPRGVGTGLGLSTARTVAESHGGFLQIESTVGIGTTVSLCLPVYPIRDFGAKPFSQTGLPNLFVGQTRLVNVLIVDDEVEVLNWLERLVQRLGYQTRQARSVAEALALFNAQPDWPDVLMLDMTLGDGSGSEIFAAVSAVRPTLQVIICSGYADSADIRRIMNSGHAMLTKPFTSRQVDEMLKQILKQQ
jgi:signal transduction histidine kinase/CheY-like chemotaxis protein